MSTLWTGTTTDEQERYYWEDRSIESRELEITELEDATMEMAATTAVLVFLCIVVALVSLAGMVMKARLG